MRTRRLHFAKKLIDETSLPMAQLAAVSGFGSVRRFNAAFRKTYKRTPSQLRRRAQVSPKRSDNEYLFRLEFRPPFHWNELLTFLGNRAILGVEVVEHDCYRRTISLNGHSGMLSVSPDESESALQVRISFLEPRWLFLIVERVRRMFDLAAAPREISAHLRSDQLLAPLINAKPGLRVPGCWDAFELAVRAILGQQVSVAGANTLAGRLVVAFGTATKQRTPLTHLFPTPTDLAEADLSCIGLPKKRAETIRSLAQAIRDGELCFSSVADPDELRSRLREIPGLGAWTAEYIAMRAIGDPDAFPAGDLALLRGALIRSERELANRAESWRPWRAYAAMYLWQAYGQRDRQDHLSQLPGVAHSRVAAVGRANQ